MENTKRKLDLYALDNEILEIVLNLRSGNIAKFTELVTEDVGKSPLNGVRFFNAPLFTSVKNLYDTTPWDLNATKGTLWEVFQELNSLEDPENATLLDLLFRYGQPYNMGYDEFSKYSKYLDTFLDLYANNPEFAKLVEPATLQHAMANAFPATRNHILEKCPNLYAYIPTEEFAADRAIWLKGYDDAVIKYLHNKLDTLQENHASIDEIKQFEVEQESLLDLCEEKKFNEYRNIENQNAERIQKELEERQRVEQERIAEENRQAALEHAQQETAENINIFTNFTK